MYPGCIIISKGTVPPIVYVVALKNEKHTGYITYTRSQKYVTGSLLYWLTRLSRRSQCEVELSQILLLVPAATFFTNEWLFYVLGTLHYQTSFW